ncbi:unnamed protein product [Periconia digitata]|uniref:Uncharacterized protein n=1 Tax=Periconia digitata TaxID=1303443 RepID=A0A9W4XTT4_9PLEO|nr:unnamed protein product [Periconia digitata]
MAHQAHAIPWHTLADHLKFTPNNSRYLDITNLYPRCKPDQGKQLQHFARVFASVLTEYSVVERRKYAAEYTAPEDSEVIISDTTAKNIEKVMREYTKAKIKQDPDAEKDPLRPRKRTIEPWIDSSTYNDCHPCDSLLETDELLRTLILYGEMDTVFRIACHPQVRLTKMWRQGNRFAFDIEGYGLCELKETALLAYICLNVFHLKPELYDPIMRARMLSRKATQNESMVSPEMYDYRRTAAYQRMLVYCTGIGYSYPHYGAHKIPHREFFGVPHGMYINRTQWRTPCPTDPVIYGRAHLNALTNKNFPHQYVPGKSDIPVVIALFRKCGLPPEIALQILDLAEYIPRGRLYIRDDPLHLDNAEELKKYLGYCWKLLVRIDMTLKANGQWLDWESEVADAVYKLFGQAYPKMSEVVVDYGTERQDVAERRARRRFV